MIKPKEKRIQIDAIIEDEDVRLTVLTVGFDNSYVAHLATIGLIEKLKSEEIKKLELFRSSKQNTS